VQIKKGNSRIVVLIPFLGIVVKFPLIRLKHCWQDGIFHLKNKNMRSLFFSWFFHPIFGSSFHLYGPRTLLFRGICCNLVEFWVYIWTRDSAFVPTYFSFFGLFNIQQYFVTADQLDLDFCSKICSAFGGVGECYQPRFFSCVKGHWKINNYGIPGFAKHFLSKRERLQLL